MAQKLPVWQLFYTKIHSSNKFPTKIKFFNFLLYIVKMYGIIKGIKEVATHKYKL